MFDLAGLEMQDGESVTGIDGAPVVLVSALTRDSDRDGTVDQLEVNFSEPVDIVDPGAADYFALSGGATILAGAYSGLSLSQQTYDILSGVANNTSITIDPTYTQAPAGSIIDLPGFEMVDAETVTGTDGASPAILASVTLDADTDGRMLIEMIEKFVAKHPNARVYRSLGQLRYLSCIQHCENQVSISP